MANDRRAVRESEVRALFAVSGNACSFRNPDDGVACEHHLVAPGATRANADVCHIRGERPGAARYDANYTEEERRSFDNLIILCPNHHREIDKINPQKYSVEVIIDMKMRSQNRGHLASDGFSEDRIDAVAAYLTLETNLQIEIDEQLARAESGQQTIHVRDVTVGGGFAAGLVPDAALGGPAPIRDGSVYSQDELTPSRVVEAVKEAAALASIPRVQPAGADPTPLIDPIPDLTPFLQPFPDLRDLLLSAPIRDWSEVADRWLENHED